MTFKQLRESHGFLTAAELARKAGVKPTTVSQLDLGKLRNPRYGTIEAIADALGVSPQMVMRSVRNTRKERS
jgi:transcriptional regulator with XRE-family HTH domain